MSIRREQLLSLRNLTTRLGDSVWMTIKDYDIKKPVRGCRGGRRKQHHATRKTSKPISREKHTRLCFLNAQSVKNKTLALADYITGHDLDVVAIAETWLGTSGDATVISELLPTGYNIKHVPRQGKSAGYGGVALIYKTSINVKVTDSHLINNFESFEHMECHVKVNTVDFILCVIYRPPPSRSNKLKTSTFFEEWSSFLDRYSTVSAEVLITGDINLHLEDTNNHDAERFRCIVLEHGMRQHVSEPTHRRGHTLDAVLTRDTDTLLCGDVRVSDPGLSDHMAISCQLSMTKPNVTRLSISYRKYKDIDIDAFKSDITDSIAINMHLNTEDMVSLYDSTLISVVDKHAPLVHKTITSRPQTEWYDDNLRQEKVKKRYLERKWTKSKLTVFHEAYREQCARYNTLLQEAKTKHYTSKVESCGRDQKAVFNLTKHLLGKKNVSVLPEHVSASTLAETFSTFFTSKITTIREDMRQVMCANDNISGVESNSHDYTDIDSERVHNVLDSLDPATEKEIRDIITKSPSKSCKLDPIPTELLKECLDELVPSITQIVNQSLFSATMPSTLKHAVIRPLLKKAGLNPEEHKNYRPISNLSFLSKVVEKVVATRLDKHMNDNNLHEPLQSAYRANHSTETALLKVQNDILQALDSQHVAVLVLLDLSAAFDTIDHHTLLTRLSREFAIKGKAYEWFHSYLIGRSQSVTINAETSTPHTLRYGVPQGSVLGPKLFGMYMKPLGSIISQHNVSCHFYADDSQLYLAFNTVGINDQDVTCPSIIKVERSIENARVWMQNNKLKLNENKTEVILFGTKKRINNLTNIRIRIGDVTITPTTVVKNLGVYYDQQLSMEQQIRAICRNVHMHLRNISRIRRYLSREACQLLVHALAISRIDYANSLLTGITSDRLKRLQKLQNVCARIVTRTPMVAHITPILKELHWLPVKARIDFKVLVLAYRALTGLSPPYITEMLSIYKPVRPLRSGYKMLLCKPATTTTTFGSRTFAHTATSLWNTLPQSIKSADTLETFRSRLKTHLFNSAY